MPRGQLFIISGPSGVGKGTIAQRLLNDMDITFSVSMTTRAPRPGEVDGKDYFFVSDEEFDKMIAEDGFLEYAGNFGNRYGTPKAPILEKLNTGHDVLLDIDIQGAINVKKSYPKGIFIFILPPSMAELRKRITGRGTETPESLRKRLGKAMAEISYIDKYDYCIVNGELEEAIARAKAILVAEHSRVTDDIYKLIDTYKEEM
jgi:guanylate kinase